MYITSGLTKTRTGRTESTRTILNPTLNFKTFSTKAQQLLRFATVWPQ